MPIKIKDPAVYECYDSAVCQAEAGNAAELFEEFASQINSSDKRLVMDIEDISKVTDAIWHFEKVELEEPRYALYANNPNEYGYDLVAFIDSRDCIGVVVAKGLPKTYFYTQEQWDESFAKTLWINRDYFQKAYED